MRRRTRCPFRLPLTALPLTALPLTALPLIALAVSLGLGIAGCTTDPTPPDEAQSPTTSPQGSTSQATSPDATTDETSPTEPPASTTSTEPDETTTTVPTPTTSSTAVSARRLRAALVPAAELPGFNDSWTWDRQRVFRGAGLALPGCSRANLIAIGGVAAVLSDYRSPASDDTAYAVQVTVRFPDEQTASRAESVLIAWHDRCEKTLRQQGRKNPQVGDIAAVTTDVATARQWLSTYGPVPGDPDATYFHAEGFVRSGHLLSYLILHNAGQDYNYEQGDEPMANALKKAAEFLNN